jgi:hypothetical protein
MTNPVPQPTDFKAGPSFFSDSASRWLEKLEGNKTYLACAMLLAYVLGARLSLWIYDKDVVLGLVAAALACLRHGIAKAGSAARAASGPPNGHSAVLPYINPNPPIKANSNPE